MQVTYTTNDIPLQSRRQYWQEVVSKTYYSLDLRFPDRKSTRLNSSH